MGAQNEWCCSITPIVNLVQFGVLVPQSTKTHSGTHTNHLTLFSEKCMVMWLAFNYFKSPSRPHTSGKPPTPIPSLRRRRHNLPPNSKREIDGYKVPST
jgi:hypothetical protein